MQYIADLHIHSRFSRATSKRADLEGYYQWAKVKGIDLLGTGDFTHPGWFDEIKEKLEEEIQAEEFREIKDEINKDFKEDEEGKKIS